MIYVYIAYATVVLIALVIGLSVWIILHNIYAIRRERLRQERRARLHHDILLYINHQLSLEKTLITIGQTTEFLSGVVAQLSKEMKEQEILRLNELLLTPRMQPFINQEIKKITTGNLHERRSTATYLPYVCPAEKISPVLIASLKDAHDEVRLAAAYSLAQLKIYSATADIINRLVQSSRIPWARAVEVISMFGHGATGPLIEILRKESSTDAKIIAITCLGFIHAPGTSQIVASFAGNPDKNIRIQVVKALGNLGDPSAFQILVDGLKDKEWEVRAMSAQSLGYFTNMPACDALEKYLGDSAYWVRYNTAKALGKFGAQGLAVLKRNLNSEDQFVCDICKQMIETIELSSLSVRDK